MDKVKFGVFGAGRGDTMISCCRAEEGVELVAICDFNEVFAGRVKEKLSPEEAEVVAFYTDFDEFIEHDMDGCFGKFCCRTCTICD